MNEAWSLDEALEALPQLAELGVAYCEQPLAAGDEGGATLKARSPIPIYVDEDCHRLGDVAGCAEIAHGINIKLAKSGGIREAVRMAHAARALGLGVMLGCMVESGLGIAAGCVVAPLCDHVDLDGNLLLAEDPWPGVAFVDGVQVPVGPAGPRCLRTAPDPRRGLLRRPALREDGARRARVRRAAGRRARSTRRGPGSSRTASRSSAPSTDALALRADDRARRRRHPGRPLPARLARAPARGDLERPARRERPARVPRRRRGAERARGAARRRAARPAPAAGRASTCRPARTSSCRCGRCSRSAPTARSGR